jgi:fibronectin type 3 domain-containing protein
MTSGKRRFERFGWRDAWRGRVSILVSLLLVPSALACFGAGPSLSISEDAVKIVHTPSPGSASARNADESGAFRGGGDRVRQDFVFEERYWDSRWGVLPYINVAYDYNVVLRLTMVPSTSGYTCELVIDPYTVERNTLPFAKDRWAEWCDHRNLTLYTRARVESPAGVWDLAARSLGTATVFTWGLLGVDATDYGTWTIRLDLGDGSEWRSKTFTLTFEDPTKPNKDERGYLIASGVVPATSEWDQTKAPEYRTTHYAGIFRYYISDPAPVQGTTVTIQALWTEVRSATGFGSPYAHVPEHITDWRVDVLSVYEEWSGVPWPEKSVVLKDVRVPETIGCRSLEIHTAFVVSPKVVQVGGTVTFGYSGTFGFEYEGISGALEVSGSVSNDYVIIKTPVGYDVTTRPICIRERPCLPPSAPTGLHASDGAFPGKVVVSWDSVAGAATYGIYRADACGGSYSKLVVTTGTSYEDTSGSPCKSYCYKVKACNACGCSDYSLEDSGSTAGSPSAPTGLSASDGAFSKKVTVGWGSVSGAARYEVYRAPSCGGVYSQIANVTSTSYDDTSVSPCTSYCYKVKACNTCGCSVYSSEDVGSTAGSPAVPTGLSASDGAFPNKVTVGWGSVPGATKYEVYRASTCGGNYSKLADVTSTSYDDTGVPPCTSYCYKVKACSACGCGSLSSEDSGSTAGGPAAPTGLSASDGAYANKIAVCWGAVSGATRYELYRASTCGGSYSKLADVVGTCYEDTSASSCTNYCYRVRACNTCGCGDYSVEDPGSTAGGPSAPTGLSASDGTYTNKVTVCWGAVPGAARYELYRASTCGGNYAKLADVTGTCYDDTSVSPCATYCYRVKACNTCGCSEYSAEDTASTAGVPPAPTGLSASDGSFTNKVALSWGSVSGATRYEVYRAPTCGGGYSKLADVTSTTYEDMSVAACTGYCYKVRACGACGCGGFSAEDPGSTAGIPAGPSGLTASDGAFANKVTLTWGSVAGATKYEVYRAPTCQGSYAKLAEVTSTSYDDASASPCASYCYKVRACGTCGCGEYSLEDAGSTAGSPAAPTTLSASDGTYNNKVVLTWGSVSGATKYEVYRAPTCGGTYSKLAEAGVTSYEDLSVSPISSYCYRVKACNTCGCSSYSSEDSGSTGVTPPSMVVATSDVSPGCGTGGKTTVSIDSLPKGLAGYIVTLTLEPQGCAKFTGTVTSPKPGLAPSIDSQSNTSITIRDTDFTDVVKPGDTNVALADVGIACIDCTSSCQATVRVSVGRLEQDDGSLATPGTRNGNVSCGGCPSQPFPSCKQIPIVGSSRDLNGDGLCEDVNGSGGFGFIDPIVLSCSVGSIDPNNPGRIAPERFDFAKNGGLLSFVDCIELSKGVKSPRTAAEMPAAGALTTVAASDVSFSVVGEKKTTTITADSLPTGIAGYIITLRLEPTGAARFTGHVSFLKPAGAGSVDSSADSSITFRDADFTGAVQDGASAVSLASVEIECVSCTGPSSVAIAVQVDRLEGDDGMLVSTDVDGGTISIACNQACPSICATLESTGWHMIAMPGAPCGGCASAASGGLCCALCDDLDPCYIYRWDPEAEKYVAMSPCGQEAYTAGAGLWVKTYEDAVTLCASVTPATEKVCKEVGEGWNQIGSPFSFPIALADVTVRYDGNEVTLAQADANHWVSMHLFAFDSAVGKYAKLDPVSGVLSPWAGYWLRTYVDCEICFAPSSAPPNPPGPVSVEPSELHSLGISAPPAPPPSTQEHQALLSELQVWNEPNPVRSVHTTTFKVGGKAAGAVTAIRVLIYDLGGALVLSEEVVSRELEWHTQNDDGTLVANGVYLYQVWVEIDGIWYPTGTGKVVVLR